MTFSERSRCDRDGARRRAAGLSSVGGSRGGHQRAHPHQVVHRSGEEELPVHALATPVFQFPHPADGLHPAKRFLDSLAHALTDGVSALIRFGGRLRYAA